MTAVLQAAVKRQRRAEAYAAKLAAETIRYEPPQPLDLSTGALVERFWHCGRPMRAWEAGDVRRAFAAEYLSESEIRPADLRPGQHVLLIHDGGAETGTVTERGGALHLGETMIVWEPGSLNATVLGARFYEIEA